MSVSLVIAGVLALANDLAPPSPMYAPTPRELVGITDISGISASPDGQLVAFRTETASVERNTYDTSWYVQRVDGTGPPVRVSDGGLPLRNLGGGVISERAIWSPDSQWIYFRVNLDGEVQVWRASASGGHTERLTSDPADVERFSISDDGRTVTYWVRATREEIRVAEREEYDAGVLVDQTTPIGQGLFGSALYNGQPMTERYSGRWMSRRGLLGDRPSRPRRLALDTRQVVDGGTGPLNQPADPPSPSIPTSALRSPGGDYLAYIDAAGARPTVSAVDASGRSAGSWACSDDICAGGSVEGISWRPSTTELVFTVRRQDRPYAQALYGWDVTSGLSRRIADAEGLLGADVAGFGSTCAFTRTRALCVTAAPATPPQVESIDLDRGGRTVLFNPNASLVAGSDITVQFVEWRDANDTRLTGYLLLPAGHDGQPLPLFVNYYACPGYMRGALGEEWPLAAMAKAGIASMCINSVRNRDEGATRAGDLMTAEAGITALIDWLSGAGLVDRTRVGMGGLSLGGEFATHIAIHTDLLSAVSVTGISVTETWYFNHMHQTGFRDQVRARWGLALPEETPDEWRQQSASYHIQAMTAPILIQPPEQEYMDLVEFFNRMRLAGRPIEVHVFPNETHIKFQPRHKLAAYERNLDWFRFWLQGYVDPDPRKAVQYNRWQDMRDRQTTSASD